MNAINIVENRDPIPHNNFHKAIYLACINHTKYRERFITTVATKPMIPRAINQSTPIATISTITSRKRQY